MMKLRNKKTGQVVDLESFSMHYKRYYENDNGTSGWQPCSTYNQTLSELNEEWEDYEEPKEYFYIYADGDIYKDIQDDVREDNGCKEIGNYFETKEEAEEAVEKLKAWKRLKDKNVQNIISCEMHDSDVFIGKIVTFRLTFCDEQTIKDLDLLFCTGENN